VTLHHPDRFGRPYSPTHPVTITESGDDLKATLGDLSAGQVSLLLPARNGLVSGSVLTNRAPGEAGHFLLLLSPPAGADRTVLPRDLSLVVDVSGSMSGDKLEQAKAALQQALGTLRPVDRFRLIAFSTAIRPFHEGFVSATPEMLREARRFVSGLEAGGGTNIAGALDASLGGEAPDHLPLLVFLTDGMPSVGEQAPDKIAATAGARIGRTRVFPVGIGHDVNTYLIERLAAEGRGTAEFIPPGANVEDVVGTLLARLARPAVTNLRIVDAPVRLEQQSPAGLPDLFYGEELVVLGRYQGSGSGPVVLEGERNGRRERFEVAASFPAQNNDNEFVGSLWAARRIGDLTRELRLEGSTAERIARIRELALRYGVITEYTSYLVQEPNAVAANERRDSPLRPAAPSAATGAVAFRRARESAEMSKTMRLDELVVTSATEQAAGSRGIRRVADRLFVDKDGIWTDASDRATVKPIAVAPYSSAYFELVRALPELSKWLLKDQRQQVSGKRASILFDPAGKTEWSPGELAALVRDFRGQ
jgi:Ca-activated chloride channel family protein